MTTNCFEHHYPWHRTSRASFDAPLSTNGVANLSPVLTVDGYTVSPMLRLKGGDATTSIWTAWGYGSDLAIAGSGTDPTANQGSPLLGTVDDAVLMNGGKYYAGSIEDGYLGTEDIVLEMVFRVPTNGTTQLIASKEDPASGAGYELYFSSGVTPVLYLDTGPANASVSGAALTAGAWYHAMCFVNRDEASTSGSQWYVNGAASGSGVDLSSVSASLGCDNTFRLGANGTGGQVLNTPLIAYFAMWKADGWHPAGASGPTAWAAVAKERFARLIGLYPRSTQGTYTPSTMTRASVAYLDKHDGSARKLYLTGSGWLRMCERHSPVDGYVSGYLPENAETNVVLQSESFSTLPWSKLWAGDLGIEDGYVSPTGATDAYGFTADATNTQHGVSQQVTLTATAYNFSVWAKAGAVSWLYLADQTVVGADGYFNLTTGEVGATGAAATQVFMESWGSGWYRCGVTFTAIAADHTLVIQAAEANGDATFAGDGINVSTYLFGAQCTANQFPSSYIPTTTASATRLGDVLIYTGGLPGGGNTKQGSMTCSVLLPHNEPTTTLSVGAITRSSDETNNRLYFYYSSDTPRYAAVSGGVVEWDFAGNDDLTDGNAHDLRYTWRTNQAVQWVDGAQDGTPDTSCTPPTGLNNIKVGSNQSGGACLNGLIKDFKVYATPRRR